MKIRIGVFFGGPSREREVSYMGGRTALDNIDKNLFEPVMVFVDGLGNFILIRREFLYQDGIRSFYPQQTDPRFEVYAESLADDPARIEAEIARIGQRVFPHEFGTYFDFAFLAMHGPFCEDGAVQGLLEWYGVPYSGPGLIGSSISMNKSVQNVLMASQNGQRKPMMTLRRDQFEAATDRAALFEKVIGEVGFPIVIKAPHQGSSIGVVILKERAVAAFEAALNQCFFSVLVDAQAWVHRAEGDKIAFLQRVANVTQGIGFPVLIEQTQEIVYHPAALLDKLNALAVVTTESITLTSYHAEDYVLIEAFLGGQEFSCGILQDDDMRPVVLPPTEIIAEMFDYEGKYKSKATRKNIPVETSIENLRKIHESLLAVFEPLGFGVCVRIDGFLTPDGQVILHDPNTIPGMSPASLIFKQTAEIGLTITQTITYLVRQSIRERILEGKATVRLRQLLNQLDAAIGAAKARTLPQKEISFGPTDQAYSAAKAEFNRTNAEGQCRAVAVYERLNGERTTLTVAQMSKDSIADLDQVISQPRHPFLVEVSDNAKRITAFY